MSQIGTIRTTDSNGTSDVTFNGTGIAIKDGGIALDNSTPVAGQLTGATIASATVSAPTLTGGSISGDTGGVVLSKTGALVENGAGTSYVVTIPIPAGATLHNIQVMSSVLWDGTAASLIVGDDDDPDGYFTATSLKATDLLVGEVLDISNAENWGGKNGAYLVAATGRKGNVATGNAGVYYAAANNIIATVTPGAADGSAGRTFITVTYSVGEAIAQVAT